MDSPLAYPLQWPVGRLRTKPADRERAKFGRTQTSGEHSWRRKVEVTIDGALGRLIPELVRLGAEHVVVSTNVEIRKTDGLPRSMRRDPEDVGVAVYFHLNGAPHVLSCDHWDRVADNIAAIAATIDAQRGITRWRSVTAEQAFAGVKALPAVEVTRPWWETLGFQHRPVNFDVVKTKYRALAFAHHPDRGGNASQLAEINVAWETAQRELQP